MGLVQTSKSIAKKVAAFFVPPVYWHQHLTTMQGARTIVEARERGTVGLCVRSPSSEFSYTALLTTDEATRVSNLLLQAVEKCKMHIENSGLKQ
jgi:hypothetical protein